MVLALGLPAIERVTYQRVNSQTRKFVGLLRTVRNDSILLNVVHRLAVNLDKNTYWVEGQREFKLLTDPGAEEEAPRKKSLKKGDDEEPPSNFQMAAKFSKEPIPLPGGVAFGGVLKEQEGLRKEGIVYVHFFPNGFAEQSILYLDKEGSDGKGYSLVVRPTGGKVDIFNEHIQSFEQVE